MKVFIIAAAVLIAVVMQLILGRRGTGSINADVCPDTDAAEPGEKFHIILRIENHSKAFYPFVRYGILIPADMDVYGDSRTEPRPPASINITGSLVLWPKKTVEKKIEVSAPDRGNYRFGNFYIETGDFLGLKEYKKEFQKITSVAVYPKPAGRPDVEETLGSIMGDFSVRRYIYEDPVLISGFREYTGREPMKSISWIQSARSGQLMAKKYDYTSEASVSVVLDSECSPSETELCFSLARSVCDMLESKGIEYDFFMNSNIGGANCRQHYFARGLGEGHFKGIMKQLAMATESVDYTGMELCRKVSASHTNVSGIVYIAYERSSERELIIARLSENPSATVNVLYVKDLTDETAGETDSSLREVI